MAGIHKTRVINLEHVQNRAMPIWIAGGPGLPFS